MHKPDCMCLKLCVYSHLVYLSTIVLYAPCLSDVGIVGGSASCKCLKLTAILDQQAFPVCA